RAHLFFNTLCIIYRNSCIRFTLAIMWEDLLQDIIQGNTRSLARGISLVENEMEGYEWLLQHLPASSAKITGITGPPGAGKSTLVDALIGEMVAQNKKVGVLCIDPSSPFNLGALLGDRIRMSEWYNHPNVFIRSLATRGSLGGLHPKIIEIADVMKAAGFDHIIIETVGVGQSEIEIAGLADTTVVVVVPEAGDEVQTMKAGLMEIADVFVVNKADRPDADTFVKNLRLMLAPAFHRSTNEIAIVKTIASQKEGIKELFEKIMAHQQLAQNAEKKYWLLAEKAFHLIQQHRMTNIDKSVLKKELESSGETNLYQFIKRYIP
ncbi:MAG: methylmalonyl Co-A mutase-associated GTPase MeaB, partial [Sediminibacterium sp.]